MVKRRKPIRLGLINRGLDLQSSNNAILTVDDILKPIVDLKNKYNTEALSNYNADNYEAVNKYPTIGDLTSRQVPDATYIQKPTIVDNNKKVSTLTSKKVKNNTSYINQNSFINDIYDSYYKAVRPGAVSDEDASRQAKFLTQKAAFETGYGRHIANTHNYGGHKTKNGWLSFNSMDDFTRRDVRLLDKKWNNWRNAKTEGEFIDSINTDNGYGQYAPPSENTNYKGRYMGLSNRINTTLSSRNKRPKAFIGAAIGAATSIVGSILSANSQKAALEEQRRIQAHQNAIKRAENLNQSLSLMQDAQREYEDRFRINYENGGRRRLRDGVTITDGGYAIPMGDKTFLLQGKLHEEVNESGNTGIGIKTGNTQIEAQHNEVAQVTPKELRIFSDSIGVDGYSFADLVKMGYDKDRLFKIQQTMNGDYGIGNKRRLRNGGYISRPVERIKADDGVRVVNGRKQRFIPAQNGNMAYWLDEGPVDNRGFFTKVSDWITRQLYSTPKAGAPKRTTTGTRAINISAQNGPFYSSNMTSGSNSKSTNNTRRTNTDNVGSYNFNTARRTQNINNAPVQTSWIGRDGRRYYGTIIQGVNGNIYKIDRVEQSSSPNSNTRGAVAADTSKSNRSLNTTKAPTTTSGNTRTIVSTNNTGTQSSRRLSIGTGASTNRRRLASRGENKSVVAQSSVPAVPNYTGQEYSDYKNSQIIGADNSNTNDDTPQFTNPSDKQLYYPTIETQKNNPKVDGVEDDGVKDVNIGNNNKLGAIFKGADWIGLGADLIGSLGSALIQSNVANSIQDPYSPVMLSPAKLITNYNIAPRLSEIANARRRMLRDSDETVSSATRLDRRNQINLLTNQEANKLWGEKTNKEIELLNADALNQQQISSQNAEAINDYYNKLAEARTKRGLVDSQAWQVGLSGLSDSIGNFLDQGKQRYSDDLALNTSTIYGLARLGDKDRDWAIKHLRLANKRNRFSII